MKIKIPNTRSIEENFVSKLNLFEKRKVSSVLNFVVYLCESVKA